MSTGRFICADYRRASPSFTGTYLYLAFPSSISTIALLHSFVGRFWFHVVMPFSAASSSISLICLGLPIELPPILAPFVTRLNGIESRQLVLWRANLDELPARLQQPQIRA
jgi:hypothetical protein